MFCLFHCYFLSINWNHISRKQSFIFKGHAFCAEALLSLAITLCWQVESFERTLHVIVAGEQLLYPSYASHC